MHCFWKLFPSHVTAIITPVHTVLYLCTCDSFRPFQLSPSCFLRLIQSGNRYSTCSILFYSYVLKVPSPVLKRTSSKTPKQLCLQPFPWGSERLTKLSGFKEADLLISLVETWLLLVTSPCATLKNLPLHPGITWTPRWWLFCMTSNSFPMILCYHLPDLCQFVAFLWIPVNFHNLFCGVACVMFNSCSSELAAFQW